MKYVFILYVVNENRHLVIYVDYFEILFLIGSKGIFLIILICFVKRYLSYFFSTKNLVLFTLMPKLNSS